MSVIPNENFVNETVSELGLLKDDVLKSIRKKLIQAENCYKEGDYDTHYFNSVFRIGGYNFFNRYNPVIALSIYGAFNHSSVIFKNQTTRNNYSKDNVKKLYIAAGIHMVYQRKQNNC
jgi:hypothetical protein